MLTIIVNQSFLIKNLFSFLSFPPGNNRKKEKRSSEIFIIKLNKRKREKNFSTFGRSEKIDPLNVRKKEFKFSRIYIIKARHAKLMFKNFQREKYSSATLDTFLIFCTYSSVNLK